MAYEILADNLYEDKDYEKDFNKRKKPKTKFNNIKLTGMIVIGFLVALYALVTIFNYTSFIFLKDIEISSDRIDVNVPFSGNLKLESNKYFVKIGETTFEPTSQEIKIENFKGNIEISNNSIRFFGTAYYVSTKSDKFYSTPEQTIEVISTLPLYLEVTNGVIDLIGKNGRVSYKNKLRYQYEELFYSMNNFKGIMEFDEKSIEISGASQTFELLENELIIKYGK